VPTPPLITAALIALALGAGCSTARDPQENGTARDTVVVFAAASLSDPMRALRDTFARRRGALVLEEHGGSLELARRAMDLHRVPDVLALADQEVFTDLLMPSTSTWYARVARNRMVVAFTPRSRYAGEMNPASWRTLLLRPDVLVGRTDPETAPAGYRTLLTFALAERFYREPGLAARLTQRSPARLEQRGQLGGVAALQAGELDYILEYESLARTHNFRFVVLPPEIDLGEASRATEYALASVRVRRGRDSVTLHGAPIMYGVSVPRGAPHRAAGVRFAAWMLGPEGRAMLRAAHVDALDHPEVVGEGVPEPIRAAIAH
jgi:molybdate/tungstate transport system substrate-binding protein